MAYTGVLKQDATPEEIMAAKKTVQIVTEVNGQKYIEEFDGTKGLIVMVDNGETTEGRSIARGISMRHFIQALLSKIPEEERTMIVADALGLLKDIKNMFFVIQGGRHAQ